MERTPVRGSCEDRMDEVSQRMDETLTWCQVCVTPFAQQTVDLSPLSQSRRKGTKSSRPLPRPAAQAVLGVTWEFWVGTSVPKPSCLSQGPLELRSHPWPAAQYPAQNLAHSRQSPTLLSSLLFPFSLCNLPHTRSLLGGTLLTTGGMS